MDSTNQIPTGAGLERLLKALGYEIRFDTGRNGWYWHIGEFDSSRVHPLEQGVEAATTAAALDCLRSCSQLLAAARVVLARWESGDLAAAVRELQVGVDAFQGQRVSVKTASDPMAECGRQPAWLLQGNAADGAWTDEAHLDKERAVLRACAIAQEWVDEGHAIDLEAMAAALWRGESWAVSDRISVQLLPIELVGSAIR